MPEDAKQAPPPLPMAREQPSLRLFTRKGLILVAVLLMAEAGLIVLAMSMFNKKELPKKTSEYQDGILPTVDIGDVNVVFPQNKSLFFELSVGLENREEYAKATAWAVDKLKSDDAKRVIIEKSREIVRLIKGTDGSVHFTDDSAYKQLQNELVIMVNHVLNATNGRSHLFPHEIAFVQKVYFKDFKPLDG